LGIVGSWCHPITGCIADVVTTGLPTLM
jgi:hypothetical protein